EIPSEVEGILKEVLFEVDEVVQVGQTVAIIETDAEPEDDDYDNLDTDHEVDEEISEEHVAAVEETIESGRETAGKSKTDFSDSDRFYSPLVKSIAKEENISVEELDRITGTGRGGR